MGKIIGVNDRVIPLQHHPITLINYVLRNAQVTVDDVLSGSEVVVRDLSKTDHLISYKQYSVLIENALRLVDDEFLGLAFGRELNVHTHGLIGLTVLAQPTVRDAVNTAIKYKKTVSPISSLIYEELDSISRVSVRQEIMSKNLERFFTEMLYSSFMRGFQTLTGDESAQIAFFFKYPQPENGLDKYNEYLGTHLHFSQARNKMEADRSYFDKPMNVSSYAVTQALEQQLREVFKKFSDSKGIVGLIRRILSEYQASEKDDFPSLDDTAAKMNTSVSTIKRKLREYDTSYQKILDEVRMEIAIDFLQNTDKAIKEIGYELGYKEPSIFSRAFKKWTGITPLDYRENFRKE